MCAHRSHLLEEKGVVRPPPPPHSPPTPHPMTISTANVTGAGGEGEGEGVGGGRPDTCMSGGNSRIITCSVCLINLICRSISSLETLLHLSRVTNLF